MAINRAATKTKRMTIRMPERLERTITKLQKRLHHTSASKTVRHLLERGIETYSMPKTARKSENTKQSERRPV